VIASVHTRFETYPRYYGMRFAEPLVEAWLRKLYRRCDALVAPSPSMVDILRAQRMNGDIGIWSRGVERTLFNPGRRDMAWRRALGIGDADFAIGFLGRLVLEKGLNVVADTLALLRERGIAHRAIVVGDGPARAQFESRLPGAAFVGFQEGADLGRAVASMDVLFNPSVTETFGNVTLEAMACALPVVAARAAGSDGLVEDGVTGRLIKPGDRPAFADALATYAADAALRKAHGDAAERVAATYDWAAINRRMADTYVRLIDARRR
jgi:glycosyltransferase involved in cell wall biosynthesis